MTRFSKYTPEDIASFQQRIKAPITAENDTAPSGYEPVPVAQPATVFGAYATVDDLADLTTAEISPEVMAKVVERFGGE